METGYIMNFNQNFSSITVMGPSGFRLFTITAGDKIEEIYTYERKGKMRIVERVFASCLLIAVAQGEPTCLRMLHFKKDKEIVNCVYPSEILSVRVNRHRLVVCLSQRFYIHDIKNMETKHYIENIEPNLYGVCALSLVHSYLAFPISRSSGELRIFNAKQLKPVMTTKAHDTALSAICFSPNDKFFATASERGTVIRVFLVKNGQRVHEFRRGVKRCVRIASLSFSTTNEFLCASSNTETVHIFKIDPQAVEMAEGIRNIESANVNTNSSTSEPAKDATEEKSKKQEFTYTTINNSSSSWASYLLPSPIWSQDRAYATVVLEQAGLKHVCGLTLIENKYELFMACEDGFLYVYNLNSEKGGLCKLVDVHDLRHSLEGVVELKFSKEANAALPPYKELKNSTTESDGCTTDEIENIEPVTSYAGILKGSKTPPKSILKESMKFQKLCDAIDTPLRLYDEKQFPPVATKE